MQGMSDQRNYYNRDTNYSYNFGNNLLKAQQNLLEKLTNIVKIEN